MTILSFSHLLIFQFILRRKAYENEQNENTFRFFSRFIQEREYHRQQLDILFVLFGIFIQDKDFGEMNHWEFLLLLL